MAYKIYLDGVLMPITPSKVTVEINNQNEIMTLINGEETNILKAVVLSDVSFELLLLQVSYPFTNRDAQSVSYYVSPFERLKNNKEPFQWILNWQCPTGGTLFYTNLAVGMEDHELVSDAGVGFGVRVKASLKQYKAYGIKTVKLKPALIPAEKPEATVQLASRPAPFVSKKNTYTVKGRDCLWNIAKKYLEDDSRYSKIYNLSKDKIKNPNLIYSNQALASSS